MFLFSLNLNVETYAKYKIELTKDACNFEIDKKEPKCLIAYSTLNLTNSDVIVYIKSNEEIQSVEGWILKENKTEVYKVLEYNESGEIEIVDLAGNKTNVKYSVDWIDKEPPEIKGIENNECVNKYLNLEYTDNVEVAEVIKNKLGDLEVYVNYFYENILLNYERGFDQNSITVTIRTMPQGATEFSYYINGEKKAVTREKTYTFEGLNEGELYKISAKTTIDGEIYESNIREQRTAIFEEINLSETTNSVNLEMKNINEAAYKIRVAAWNEENGQDDIQNYYIENINNKEFKYEINIGNHGNKKGVYSVHVYIYDKNGNELGMYPGRYEFIEDRDDIEYEFNKDGTYEVIVKDTANNKTSKIFTIDTVKPVVNVKCTKTNNCCVINNVEITDSSKIVKVEYVRNDNVESIIEKTEITNDEIENYSFNNINSDSLFIKIYDEAGNCQIVKL